MELKKILVHLDTTEGCPARLDAATVLAKKYGAHLTGLFVVSHPYYALRKESLEVKDSVHRLFEQKTAKANVFSDWLGIDGTVTNACVVDHLICHSATMDLVIIGRQNTHNIDRRIPLNLPERLVAEFGRAILVLPNVEPLSDFRECVSLV